MDGGGSVLHMGVTLYGRRDLVLEEPDGAKHVLENSPGLVYVGTLTGPEHQVLHKYSRPDELLDLPGLGPCSVTVMCRTSLFPYNRSRIRGTTPSPKQFFETLTASFQDSLLRQMFRLPTLGDCTKAHSAAQQ